MFLRHIALALHAEASSLNPWHLQVGLGRSLVRGENKMVSTTDTPMHARGPLLSESSGQWQQHAGDDVQQALAYCLWCPEWIKWQVGGATYMAHQRIFCPFFAPSSSFPTGVRGKTPYPRNPGENIENTDLDGLIWLSHVAWVCFPCISMHFLYLNAMLLMILRMSNYKDPFEGNNCVSC